MSSGRPDISQIVDAMVLAARAARLSQRFLTAELPRLVELSVDPESDAHLEARFHMVDGRCGIAGSVAAKLKAKCQRCLQPLEVDIEDQFHVVLVKSEAEMNELPDEQDSMIADTAQLDLAWLAEEQLLLAMPLVPLHAEAECGAQIVRAAATPEDGKQTPFAQLRELMKKTPIKNS